MDKFAEVVGRSYRLFDYVGAPDAERVIVMMGSGAEAAAGDRRVSDRSGRKSRAAESAAVPAVFSEAFPGSIACVPCASIAVLDRTKEAGAAGDPLYLDVVNALQEGLKLRVCAADTAAGRRWRTLWPVLQGIYPRHGESGVRQLCAGITERSFHGRHPRRRQSHQPDYDPEFSIEPDNVVRAMFYGLGADGTVGANKNSIKIIGENTDNYAQGYFVYDSKKSGAMTVSHLRFGPEPIHSTLSGFEGQLRGLPSVDIP